MNVSVLLFDVVAAAILLSVALLGAYLPVVLSRMGEKSGAAPTRNLAYVLGNMLSAGVMVSAGFVHLLGTAIRELDPYQQFPLAPFLCGLGFMLTLLADRIAETLSERAGWDGLTPCGSGDTHLDHEAALLRVVVSGTPSRTSDRGEGRENGALGRDKDASAGPGLVLRSGAVLEAEPLPDREVAESKRLSLEIGDAGDRTSGRGQAGSSGDRRGEANGTQTQLLQRTASRGRLKAQEVADAVREEKKNKIITFVQPKEKKEGFNVLCSHMRLMLWSPNTLKKEEEEEEEGEEEEEKQEKNVITPV